MRRTAAVTVAVLALAGCGRAGGNAASSGTGDRAKGAQGVQAQPVRVGKAPAAVDPALLDREVIRTARLTVRVGDVDGARHDAVAAAERGGGFLEAEHSDAATETTLTLRVRPESYTELLDALAHLGTVVRREVATEDVTGDVADVAGRLKAARASADRLRGLIDRAGTLSEVAALESELSDRESDIESLAGRQRALAAETSLATVTVTLTRQPPPAPKVAATGFSGGLRSGWRAFTDTTRVVLVVLGALLPFLVLGAAAVAPVVVQRRRRRVRVSATG